MSDLESPGSYEVVLSRRQTIDLVIQLAIGAALVVVSFRILEPFLTLIVWGGIIAIAIYPAFLKAVEKLGGRRKLAVTIFVLVGVVTIVVPLFMISSSLFDSAQELTEGAQEGTLAVPPPPPKVQGWPVVGTEIHDFWLQASTNLQAFVDKYRDELQGIIGSLVVAIAGAGAGVLQIILSVLVAGIFLASAEACVGGFKTLFRRLFGEERGWRLIETGAKTVRSVATGVLGVAFVQAVLAALGLAVAGVPWVGLWSLGVLLLAIMQLPPIIILLPLALWVFGSTDSQLIAWGFLVWAILVSLSDAVLKPMFLGRGVDVPMIVVLLGAIGGMILGGIVGLFAGAVVLAVAYEVLTEWLRGSLDGLPSPEPASAGEGSAE